MGQRDRRSQERGPWLVEVLDRARPAQEVVAHTVTEQELGDGLLSKGIGEDLLAAELIGEPDGRSGVVPGRLQIRRREVGVGEIVLDGGEQAGRVDGLKLRLFEERAGGHQVVVVVADPGQPEQDVRPFVTHRGSRRRFRQELHGPDGVSSGEPRLSGDRASATDILRRVGGRPGRAPAPPAPPPRRALRVVLRHCCLLEVGRHRRIVRGDPEGQVAHTFARVVDRSAEAVVSVPPLAHRRIGDHCAGEQRVHETDLAGVSDDDALRSRHADRLVPSVADGMRQRALGAIRQRARPAAARPRT